MQRSRSAKPQLTWRQAEESTSRQSRLSFRMPAMRLLPAVVLMLLLALNVTGCGAPEAGTRDGSVGQPPVAEKQPKTITVHGDSRVDDYFWLREKNEPEGDGAPAKPRTPTPTR